MRPAVKQRDRAANGVHGKIERRSNRSNEWSSQVAADCSQGSAAALQRHETTRRQRTLQQMARSGEK